MNVLLYGLQVTVIGLAVVFSGLVILIGCVKLMGMILAERKKEQPRIEPASAPVAVPAAEEAPAIESGLDPEVIAAISAAIAAFDNSGKALVVRSVRRVSGWNRSARQEQVYRF